MLYLSPVWHSLLPQLRHRFGYIIGIDSGKGPIPGIEAGHCWMLDNGAFSDKWSESAWMAALERWQPYTSTCIAAVCPDVVGDAAATLERFRQYAPIIQQYGYPVAFVTQDGLTMDMVPWAEFDVLFVGGTDNHKLNESMPFIVEAKQRGLWVHVGRINSATRMAQFWLADSSDGTMLAVEPSIQRQRYMLQAAESAKGRKENLCFTF